MTDPVSLTYMNTLEEIVALQLHNFAHSTHEHKSIRLAVLVGIMMCLAIGVISAIQNELPFTLLGVCGAIFIAIVGYRLMSGKPTGLLARLTKKEYAQGKNQSLVGKHRLVITERGLVDNSDAGVLEVYWAGIKRIVEVPGYTYIYISASQAHVVPERGALDGDYSLFIAELKSRWESAHKNDSVSIAITCARDDLVAFQVYMSTHSAMQKAINRFDRFFILAIPLVACLYFYYSIHSIGWALLGALVVSCVAFGVLSVSNLLLSYARRREAQASCAEINLYDISGSQGFVITDRGLIKSTDGGAHECFWASIERIVVVPGYTFVMIGATQAHVIPERGVLEGDYNVFTAELKRRWEEAHKYQA